MLFCVTKGNMKFGLRFFCLPIHPMRIGNTMMNALLFNVLLLLITSVRRTSTPNPHPSPLTLTPHPAPLTPPPPPPQVSVVQFCTRAFASYARLTAADLLFGVQVENLMGLNYFFQVRVTP